MLANQLAAAIAAAPSWNIHDLAQKIWGAHGEGLLSDDVAQSLAEAVQARHDLARMGNHSPQPSRPPVTVFRPRKPQRAREHPERIARRRGLASSAPLPPALASRFTVGELAVLRIVADEHRDQGACLVCLDAIAARAGVCRSLAKKALRIAQGLGLVSITERRRRGQKNLPNMVKVIDPAWLAWMRRGARSEHRLSDKGIGVKKNAPTDTVLRSDLRSGLSPSVLEPWRQRESHSEQRSRGFRLSRDGSGEGSAR